MLERSGMWNAAKDREAVSCSGGELQCLMGRIKNLTSQFGQGLDLKEWPQFPTTVVSLVITFYYLLILVKYEV